MIRACISMSVSVSMSRSMSIKHLQATSNFDGVTVPMFCGCGRVHLIPEGYVVA